MLPRTAVALLCLLSVASSVEAASRLGSYFDTLEHELGTLQRGKVASQSFLLHNTGSEELHIRSLRVSCGCTRAETPVRTISPGHATAINTVLDTSGFEGAKSVTIFVQFDRPRREEVALRLHCVSKSDTAQSVHEVDFGIVEQSKPVRKQLNIDYRGNADWKIERLDYGSPSLQADVEELSRDADHVRYRLNVLLKDSAPAGPLEDRIQLYTNDPANEKVTVVVNAVVEPSVAVLPETLKFGKLVSGKKVTKNLVIKSSSPFRILRVDNTKGHFKIRSAPTAKKTQLVVVTLDVPSDTSDVTDHLEFVTDLSDEQVITVDVAE
ncbi:hypothetical protein Pan216_27200 [Planctomycetes bacterium Pan216]|uniref:DUF1573 domain-containing protein n=1 Tax=Kolteria novifilia TaxID=2527975 RepID=A0A518B4E8_9BACT|nr:hypothetical protein Pan216_27200 [Planctomycetes bacterium Pan216]